MTGFRHSDEVLETVLFLAGRHDLITARKLGKARENLREMLEMIDDLQTGKAVCELSPDAAKGARVTPARAAS